MKYHIVPMYPINGDPPYARRVRVLKSVNVQGQLFLLHRHRNPKSESGFTYTYSEATTGAVGSRGDTEAQALIELERRCNSFGIKGRLPEIIDQYLKRYGSPLALPLKSYKEVPRHAQRIY